MTNKEYENLLLAIQKYKNICISIELYCEFLSNKSLINIFDPSTDKDVVRLGLYGKVNNTGIYVSRICNYDNDTLYIRVSNNDNIIVRSNIEATGWSPLLKLEDFDRLNQLNAFW